MDGFVDNLVKFSDAQRLDLDVSDLWKKVTLGETSESIDDFLKTVSILISACLCQN